MQRALVDLFGVSMEMLIMYIFFFSVYPEHKKINLKFFVSSALLFALFFLWSSLPLELFQRNLLCWASNVLFFAFYPGNLSRKILLAYYPLAINIHAEFFLTGTMLIIHESAKFVMANEITQYTQGVFFSKLIALFFILLLVKTSSKHLRTVSKTVLAAVVFALAISVALVDRLFMLLLLADNPAMHLEFCFICMSVILLNAMLFYVVNDTNKKEQMNLEYLRMVNAQKAQELLSRELFKRQEETNILIHDIHNKLLSLMAYVKQKDYQKLLQQIQFLDEEIQANKFILSSYPELDALLCSKINKAKQTAITVIPIIVDFKINIDIFELNAIIGNLLDNAIENCRLDPTSNKKEIQLIIKTNGNMLSIAVHNTIDQKVNIDKNQLIPTTKADNQTHGIGLKSIHYITKKHNGNFQLSSTDNRFSAYLMLPVAIPTEAK